MTIKDEFCFQAALGSEGPAGAPGKDGLTPFINEAGNWQIGLSDTGVKAAGTNGAPGKDGLTPVINPAGNWQIGPNDTGIKAAGENGRDGQNGTDGTPARVNVAGTETLEPNAPAQVINRGTEQNAQLLFKIPRGARGEETTLRQPHYDTFADLLREHPAGTVQEAYVVGILNDIYIWDPVVHNWVSVGRLGWLPDIVEEELNKKQDRLTVEQMAAVNSGMTADKRDAYDAYADEIKTVAADGKAYTDDKTGEVRDLVNALQLVKFVSALPETGESKYLYAVPQDEKTLDGENIVLLFVWNDTDGWATVGVQTTAVDLSEYAKQADLTAETSARQKADLALETATAAKYGPDNLTAGAGVEIKEYTVPTLIDAHTLAVFKFEDTAVPAENSVAEGAVFANRGGSADEATAACGAKFGAGAFRCAGSNVSGWLRNSDSIPNADYTVDFWVKWGNSGRAGVCTGVNSDAPTGRGVIFYKNKLALPQASGTGYINKDSVFDTAYDGAVWHHVAYEQKGHAYRVYIDGVQVAQGEYTSFGSQSELYIWGWGDVLIDEVRVSGIARYAGDFTPNAQPYAYAEHKQYEITATARGAGLPLLSVHWSDHLLNRMDMLRADTFSWQDGTVYTAAYQELLGEYNLVDKFYPFSYTGAASGEIQYFCKGLIPAVGDAVYKLGDDGVYIPAENTSTGAALLVTSVEMDTNYFGHETALIGIKGYTEKFIQGDYGSTGKIEDTAPRFSAGILETENGVSFVRTPKGYKICAADQHDNVAALYESTGAAWYYILDVPNKRFKLPRTKFGFTGLRTGAGNYVAPGLPNITAKMMGATYGGLADAYVNASGACRTEGSGGAAAKGGEEIFLWKHDFDASRSSSVYGVSQTVQPPATEMYLYFFVGNFTQSAVEQTAGLNAELFNGKADTDLANVASNIDYVVESYSDNDGNWYRVWSGGWIEQGGQLHWTATRNPGIKTVTLYKVMVDANYNTQIETIRSNGGTFGTSCLDHTTTAFSAWTYGHGIDDTSVGIIWYVCGQGAE